MGACILKSKADIKALTDRDGNARGADFAGGRGGVAACCPGGERVSSEAQRDLQGAGDPQRAEVSVRVCVPVHVHECVHGVSVSVHVSVYNSVYECLWMHACLHKSVCMSVCLWISMHTRV